jgi:hypothetical protein
MNAAEFESHRRAIPGPCYRMPGSAVDAGDAAQRIDDPRLEGR